MTEAFRSRADGSTIPIVPIEAKDLAAWLRRQTQEVRAWVESSGFKAKPGAVSLRADANGRLAQVLLGYDPAEPLWALAGLPSLLPPGSYALEPDLPADAVTSASIGWALAQYRFDRYKTKADANGKDAPTLVWPKGADRALVEATVAATTLVRDLINTPAGDMGPPELADAARRMARPHGAKVSVIAGDALLKRNYPTIHAVGRAAAKAPRLIDLTWGRAGAPKVTLVGKGVCFDSGGLDLKPASGMLRMKKDMGGGATVLGLADMIMRTKLDVRLRVLVPAVENSVSGNAYRPLDVIKTRKGITVEVGNTDAEGRLVMCDALAEGDREKPALMVDVATLTGAARVAVGTELAALFCNDDALADGLIAAGHKTSDPMWRMPLWQPYRRLLDSKVADINNVSEGGFAGAITAALYLKEFVSDTTPWAHLDLMAWNQAAKPGRPVGGEAQTMRALYALIAERFGGKGKPGGRARATRRRK